MTGYHDSEWGTPVHGEAALFQALVLTCFENGLSWAVVFNKREALCQAFADFDPDAMATMTDRDVDLLMKDHTIIRNRAKIVATVHNARLLTSMSLNDIAWHYRPRHRHPLRQWSDGRAQSPESQRLATELRRRGFRFVGPVVAHSFMQTVGIENGHFDGCFLRHRPTEFADGLDTGTTRCRTMVRPTVRSVALHDAELVAFGIGEDDNNSLGIFVALSRISATEFNDPSSRGVHISTATYRWMRTLPALGSGTG